MIQLENVAVYKSICGKVEKGCCLKIEGGKKKKKKNHKLTSS
jgi:hypothetical protein